MGMTRMTEKQRPAKKFVPRTMREDRRSNRETGVPWGQEGWPDVLDSDDLTFEIFGERPAQYANLAALKADATYGDGDLDYESGADFASGQFVSLANGTLAHYASAAWSAGAKA